MNSQNIDSNNTSTASAKEKLMNGLRVTVTDSEIHLRAAVIPSGEEAIAASVPTQRKLQVVKDSMVEAGISMIDLTRSSVKGTDQYVRDNVWNWK